MDLHEFISTHHDEIVERARAKLASRVAPLATTLELTNGVPLFLTQLGEILGRERSSTDNLEMGRSATLHGAELLKQGFSVAQVVHDYGDLCQAVTELALELGLPIGTEDFHTLNRCLDDAIASAVTEFARQRDLDTSHAELKRQGYFAHELRNHLSTAMFALEAVKSGRVGVGGGTFAVLERSLQGLREVISRSVAEVRLASVGHRLERFRLAALIHDVTTSAALDARTRGVQLLVEPVDPAWILAADRHLLASALSNLLQNAFKFTRASSQVRLRCWGSADRVLIEIEDECGGLAPGVEKTMFRPFARHGSESEGLGLGLPMSRRAIAANGGTLSVRDLPGKGCVFVVDLPLAADD